MVRLLQLIAAMLLGVATANIAGAQEVAGSGSTFAFPIMARWAEAYRQMTGVTVGYQPVGSASGILAVQSRIVDFAVTDAPLVNSQLLRDGLMQFPLVIGAIVPVVNLDGIKPGQLHLTGDVLANIYLGRIRSWQNPAITELNPGVPLPDRPIVVIYRSDGSGTTYNWTDYLSKVNSDWLAAVGSSLTVRWPVGFGGKGNGGVAEKIAHAKGSIGYVEYSYAVRAQLSHVLVRNRAGQYVPPSAQSLSAAVASADWRRELDFNVLLSDCTSPDAYPIMATSFGLVSAHPRDPIQARKALGFFRWTLNRGQAMATALEYLPLPPPLVDEVEAYWAETLPIE